MVVRRAEDGTAAKEGAQVQIGGNDVYVSLCRRHWREEVGDRPVSASSPAGKLRGGHTDGGKAGSVCGECHVACSAVSASGTLKTRDLNVMHAEGLVLKADAGAESPC